MPTRRELSASSVAGVTERTEPGAPVCHQFLPNRVRFSLRCDAPPSRVLAFGDSSRADRTRYSGAMLECNEFPK